MARDPVVLRELKTLQDELSASQRARAAAAAPDTSSSPDRDESTETGEEHELRDQLRELANEVTAFFEEAERSISAHPMQSVLGAMLAGILIGRLLGRR